MLKLEKHENIFKNSVQESESRIRSEDFLVF